MEKLFGCAGRVDGGRTPSRTAYRQRLDGESERHAKATVSRSLEQNSVHFNEAREKLEKWADDMVLSAEKALKDTKEQIKALRRQARQAVTLEEQHEIQEKIQKLERQQRRQRQEIFKAEDEIMEKRDALIDSLEKRLAQRTDTEALFTIRWAVVWASTDDEDDRMSQKYEKLKTLLKELFQLDQPDLDFGLYRVMHAKSAEVTQFLDKDLLPQVKAAFGQYQTADKAEIEKELAKVIASIEAAGMNPDARPRSRSCAPG